MSNHLAIVMAAGKGTRMKSELPKVLVEVAGRPMIEYVLDALRAGGIEKIVVVVGYRSELVRNQLAHHADLVFVQQTEQLGTGHAVMVCRDQLGGHEQPSRNGGGVLIVAGDSPLMQSESIRAMLEHFEAQSPACLIGTARADDPTGLGRVLRNADGGFLGIVEQKDASAEQQAITEVNMSTYVFAADDLMHALDRLTTDNAQQEYYITDCPGILQSEGKQVLAECVLQPCETMSINTAEELVAVEAKMRRLGLAGSN